MRLNWGNKRSSVIILIFIIAAFSGCGLLFPENKLPDAKLELTKTVYQKGEKLTGVFSVTNNTDNDLSYNFGSGCQYGLRISDKSGVTFEYPFLCPAVLSSLYLKKGQKEDYKISIVLRDDKNQLLTKGTYEIKAYIIGNSNIADSAEFEIK